MIKKNNEPMKMIKLNKFSDYEITDMKKNSIKYNKTIGYINKKSRQSSKVSNCYYCGALCSSFCNSHSIPGFCLRNIAINGYVFTFNEFLQMPLSVTEKGVKNSGTFQLLCNECDSKIFSDYENPNNYEKEPTVKSLAQIAMKNYLKNIGKRLLEIQLYDNLHNDYNMSEIQYIQQQIINNLDVREYIDGFNYAKKVSEKCSGTEYYLFYYEKLDYVVPIAFQSSVTLISDFYGNIINDIYVHDSDKPTKELHVCIFPLEDSSVIMMFINRQDKRYQPFYRQFNRLSHDQKLAAVVYIIFLYSEDMFIYKGIDKSVSQNKKLIEACNTTSEIDATFPVVRNPLTLSAEIYDLSKFDGIPNLLSEEYKIR